MKYRILFIIESMRCGGAERSLANLLSQIDYNKYNVDLMMMFDHEDMSFGIPEPVNIISLPKPKGLGNLWHKLCHLYHSLKWRLYAHSGKRIHGAEILWSCMSSAYPTIEQEYDIAIAYQQGMPTYYAATKVKAKHKVAWINVNIVNAGYRRNFNKPYYNRYDTVVAVSNELYDIMSKSGYVSADKLEVIYDIVDVDNIRHMATKDDVSGIFGNARLKITTVGRVATQKNYTLAVKTATVLRDRGLDFRWVFVGEGPESELIRNLIYEQKLENNVIAVGKQSNPYPFIAACDIYVQTSLFEGFGLTIAEAKALGKPIVSTNFDVVYDQLQDGVNGLICEMNPESVAEKIMQIYQSPELTNKLHEAVTAEQNKSKAETKQRFDTLIEKLIASK